MLKQSFRYYYAIYYLYAQSSYIKLRLKYIFSYFSKYTWLEWNNKRYSTVNKVIFTKRKREQI